MDMLGQHKFLTAIGGVGALVIFGHLLLGPDVVPVAAVLVGLALVASASLAFFRARRGDERARDDA